EDPRQARRRVAQHRRRASRFASRPRRRGADPPAQRLGADPPASGRGAGGEKRNRALARSRPSRAATGILRHPGSVAAHLGAGRPAARQGRRSMAAAGAVTEGHHAPAYRWRFWVAAAIVFLLLLWLLNDILLPFVVGAVVAYFFDPVVVRLHRIGLSRTWATATVTVLAALITVGAATAILPPLFGQIEGLIIKAPDYV